MSKEPGARYEPGRVTQGVHKERQLAAHVAPEAATRGRTDTARPEHSAATGSLCPLRVVSNRRNHHRSRSEDRKQPGRYHGFAGPTTVVHGAAHAAGMGPGLPGVAPLPPSACRASPGQAPAPAPAPRRNRLAGTTAPRPFRTPETAVVGFRRPLQRTRHRSERRVRDEENEDAATAGGDCRNGTWSRRCSGPGPAGTVERVAGIRRPLRIVRSTSADAPVSHPRGRICSPRCSDHADGENSAENSFAGLLAGTRCRRTARAASAESTPARATGVRPGSAPAGRRSRNPAVRLLGAPDGNPRRAGGNPHRRGARPPDAAGRPPWPPNTATLPARPATRRESRGKNHLIPSDASGGLGGGSLLPTPSIGS
jgi:hypothetical protein